MSLKKSRFRLLPVMAYYCLLTSVNIAFPLLSPVKSLIIVYL